MQATQDFTPIAPDESEVLAFDFSSYLSDGDTIATVQACTCTVAPQSLADDDTPSSRLIGSATVDTATSLVTQRVAGCVAGVLYVLQAVVTTAGGDTLSIWAYLQCKPVGEP